MSSSIESQANAFIKRYADLFSSPDASSSERVANLAKEIGECYRPGMTVFTNGKVERFETQAQAAALIEREMRNNIATGLGTKLVLQEVEKIEVYSEGSALCWLKWEFVPQAGSEFEGKGWRFTNVYGFRAMEEERHSGWEFVVRDHEVNEIVRVTGSTFE